MVPGGHVRMGSTGVRAPVWTTSGMRYWKRLIIIPGGTDCYYCINNMTCLIHVFYCLVVHVPVPDHFASSCYLYMLLPYLFHAIHFVASYSCTCLSVTLPGTCYSFCGGILRMFCIASILFSYAHLHVHIAYAHLYGHCYHVTTRRQYLWYQPDTPKDMTRW